MDLAGDRRFNKKILLWERKSGIQFDGPQPGWNQDRGIDRQKEDPLVSLNFPANNHEIQLLEETLGNIMADRPHPKAGKQHICGDKAYDSIWCRESAGEYGYIHHFRRRREENPENKKVKPKRWVVERTHAWMNQYRRILNRWDITARSYESFIVLACAAIVLSSL